MSQVMHPDRVSIDLGQCPMEHMPDGAGIEGRTG